MTRNVDAFEGIPFTQYLMPNGEPKDVSIVSTPNVLEKAQLIIDAGFCFECEMLADYTTISFSVSDELADYSTYVCENGPQVPLTVDRMILEFDIEGGKANRDKIRDDNARKDP